MQSLLPRRTGTSLAATLFLMLVSIGLGLQVQAATQQPVESAAVDFARDIRPILSDQCFHCHGPDPNTREAGLRLDTEAGLFDGGLVVVPGNPDESELFQRISSDDEELRMPPASSHKSLTDQQVKIIHEWIAGGAEYQGHWSFEPIDSPRDELPASAGKDASAVVDYLIDQQLDKHQLEANDRADPRTLIRRLHLDLTGLPPSPEVLQQFLADPSPEAYRDQVAQLLESPHFGEQMAMKWLDLVRYADTVGYHGDQDVSVSPYRDYVIESFNSNKPFDQFTMEQLAGDLLPEPDQEQKIASGYNRLGMMSAEGGVQPKEYLAKYIAERVRNVSGTWMGITMGCCECHDHKYDPISTREFYQMEAFFADIKERGLYAGANRDGRWGPTMMVPTASQTMRLQEIEFQLKQAREKLAASTPELLQAQTEWERGQVKWDVLRPENVASSNQATLTVEETNSIVVSGEKPATDNYTLQFSQIPSGTTAIRLEVLPHPSLPKKGPGRAGNGNFVLSEIKLNLVRGEERVPVELARAVATFEQSEGIGDNPYGRWVVEAAIDDDVKGEQWGWAIAGGTGKPQAAAFMLAGPITLAPNEQLEIQLLQRHQNPHHTLGHFRLSATVGEVVGDQPLVIPDQIQSLIAIKPDQRTAEQQQEVTDYFRSQTPLLEPVRATIKAGEKMLRELEAQVTTTLVTESVAPREIRVLGRGNWMDDTGEIVQPGFPQAVNVAYQAENSKQRLTRLDLAKWLVSGNNPLTARVFANRLWSQFFGRGLARNLDDFGAQGAPPTHPRLLDYLARQFIDSGWNVKQLVQTIVLSEAYQRSSVATESIEKLDPENLWFARQNQFRLPAETVRDNALAISGLLVDRIGGKSVKPYQPAGYYAYLNFPPRKYQADRGNALYRRGLYVHWQRQYLHPSLLAFDAPNREECTAQRPISNTPLQSLVLLNDPTYVEAARAFGERIIKSDSEFEARVNFAYRVALSRLATPDEIDILKSLYQRALKMYQDDPQLAVQALAVGEYAADPGVDQSELAAWSTLGRAILNLHETITRY